MLGLGLAVAGACGAPPHPEEPRPAPATPATRVSQSTPPRWRVNVRDARFHDAQSGHVLLRSGQRLIVRDGQAVAAARSAAPALLGSTPIPSHLGHGYLFWSHDGLYRARDFLGALEPLAALSVRQISFGPDRVLVRTQEWERHLLGARTGKRLAVDPLGLVDYATRPGGKTAVALLDWGQALLTTDGGQQWLDVTAQLPSPPLKVELIDGQLWVALEQGSAALRADGSWSVFGKEGLSRARAMNPQAESEESQRWAALEGALAEGTLLGAGQALVVANQELLVLDLTTARVVARPPIGVPPGARCTVHRLQAEVVVACVGNGSLVLSGFSGALRPTVEIAFAGDGPFFADDQTLLFAGPCSGGESPKRAGAVCVRRGRGRWQEYDVTQALSAPPRSPSTRVIRWVPASKGGAVGFVGEPRVGMVDAATGAFAEFPPERRAAAAGVLSLGGSSAIHRDWTAAGDGTLQGWHAGQSYRVDRTGAIVAGAYKFNAQAASGRHALGLAAGRYYQSTDWGRSFEPVAGPPFGSGVPKTCSPVGCNLDGWFRLGWETERQDRVEAPLSLPPAPELPKIALPRLRCSPLGPEHQRQVPDDLEALATGQAQLGFGARLLPRVRGGVEHFTIPLERVLNDPARSPSTSGLLRALITGRAAGDDEAAVPNLGRSVWFTSPLDPRGEVLEAGFRLRDVLRFASDRDDASGLLYGSYTPAAVPVLGTGPGEMAGLVLFDGRPLLWLRAQPHARVTTLPLPEEYSMTTLMSAAATGPDELTLLLYQPERIQAVVLEPQGARRLFSMPRAAIDYGAPVNPETLLLGRSGIEGILATPGGSRPPTTADPALLLRPGARPQPLAPWFTLTPANAPECEGLHGPRAFLETRSAWFDVELGGSVSTVGPSFALVRWGRGRVCLEAVEAMVEGREDADFPTYVAARFAPEEKARRLGFSEGTEASQEIRCTLVPVGAPPHASPNERSH